jgi:hypothetical protein
VSRQDDLEVVACLSDDSTATLRVLVEWGTPPQTSGPPDAWDPGDPGYADPDPEAIWSWTDRYTAEGDALPDWSGLGKDAPAELRRMVKMEVERMWENADPPFDEVPDGW